MPSGAPFAPRRLPAHLAWLGGLPERKVCRAALGLLHIHSSTGYQIFQLFLAQFAVIRERLHGKVHVAIIGSVGVATGDQLLDHGNDVVDKGSRPRLIIG